MTKWSGLAPAVDAHLAKFRDSHDNRAFYELLLSSLLTEQAIHRAWRNAHTRRWLIFAASYGLPTESGRPMQLAQLPTEQFAKVRDLILEESTIAGIEQFDGNEQTIYQGALLARREHAMLNTAVSYYVSGAVVDEVTEASEQAEPEPIWPTDIFVPAGFAVLEKPLVVPDIDPETGAPTDDLHVWIRALGWHTHGGIGSVSDGTIGHGITVFFYTTKEDYAAGYYADLKASGRKDPYEPDVVDEGLLPIEVIPWRFGMPWEGRREISYRPGTVPIGVAYERRWMLAFFRLQWQQIIVHHREEQKRTDARRWERMANRKELLDYTVLRLRREYDPVKVETGTGVPLDRRVRVRAHWTRQWFPSMGPARMPDGSMNPESHRLLWIEAYFKGPEDAPMGPIHPATSFSR